MNKQSRTMNPLWVVTLGIVTAFIYRQKCRAAPDDVDNERREQTLA